MIGLVIQTFVLMAIAVALGVGLGALARRLDFRLVPADQSPGEGGTGEIRPEAGGRPVSRGVQSGAKAKTAEPVLPNDSEPEEPVPETVAATVDEVVAEAEEVVDDLDRSADADRSGRRPSGLDGPIGGKADDLRVIRGIGPENQRRLNGLGIYHLSQIAAWTPEEARWVGTYLAFPGRIEREDWIGQARARTRPA